MQQPFQQPTFQPGFGLQQQTNLQQTNLQQPGFQQPSAQQALQQQALQQQALQQQALQAMQQQALQQQAMQQQALQQQALQQQALQQQALQQQASLQPSLQPMQAVQAGPAGPLQQTLLAMQQPPLLASAPQLSLQAMPSDVQQAVMTLDEAVMDVSPFLTQACVGEFAGVAPFVTFTYLHANGRDMNLQLSGGGLLGGMGALTEKYKEALHNNPDPALCYPAPIIGAQALEARARSQEYCLRELQQRAEGLKNGFADIRDHLHAVSRLKLEQVRKRHQNLARMLLEAITAIESTAWARGTARVDRQLQAEVDSSITGLEVQLLAPSSARCRLEELRAVVRSFLAKVPSATTGSGAALQLSSAAAEKTLRLTQRHVFLVEQLDEEIVAKKRELTRLEYDLAVVTCPMSWTELSALSKRMQ